MERKTNENKLKYFSYTKVHKTFDDFKIEILSKRLGYIAFATRLKHHTCIGNNQLSEEKKQGGRSDDGHLAQTRYHK